MFLVPITVPGAYSRTTLKGKVFLAVQGGVSSVERMRIHIPHLSDTCAVVRCFQRRYAGSGAEDWML